MGPPLVGQLLTSHSFIHFTISTNISSVILYDLCLKLLDSAPFISASWLPCSVSTTFFSETRFFCLIIGNFFIWKLLVYLCCLVMQLLLRCVVVILAHCFIACLFFSSTIQATLHRGPSWKLRNDFMETCDFGCPSWRHRDGLWRHFALQQVSNIEQGN